MIQTMNLAFKLNVIAAMWALAFALRAGPPASAFEHLGTIGDPALPELSGLAPSHRVPGLHWAISDSGNAAELVALDPVRGKVLGVVAIEGAYNQDWEDLASFERDGQSWLLIADVGDNLWLRSELRLILVPEPAPDAKQVTPARSLRLRYADGPRDCEAVAVDAVHGRVLLADKGRHPAGLYEAALDGDGDERVATRIADFPELVPTPPPRVQPIGGLRGRGTPTAMDLSADGLRLIVMTYLSATLFERAPGQSWAEALLTPRLSERLPREPGFEAMGFEADGRSAVLGNERVPAKFFRWNLARGSDPARTQP